MLKVKSTLIIPAIFSCIAFMPFSEQKRYNSIAGPFKIEVRRCEHCPPGIEVKTHAEYSYRFSERRFRTSEDAVVSAEIMSPYEVNDSATVHFTIASWSQRGGWKENAHMATFKRACHTGWMYPPVRKTFIDLAERCFGERLWLCPLVPGIYRVDNYTVTIPELPFKTFFYGRWKGMATMIFPKQRIVGCLLCYADTVPV